MTELILRQDIDKLGKAGTVVKVKEGFARNYLIPQGLAYPATPANLKRIEQEKQKRQQDLEKEIKTAGDLAERLNGVSCTIAVEVKAEDEIYGSITDVDISRALEAEGFNIDKRNILLNEPIKRLGIYDIEVKLHPEVTAKIKAWVVKK